MKKTVDYPGRTSCACPYLNNPDPQAHWKDCGYRLNASQPQPAEVEQPEVVGYRLKKSNQLSLMNAGADDEPLMTITQHRRITAQLRADRDEWRKIAHQLEQANAGIAQLNGQLRAECELMHERNDSLARDLALCAVEREKFRARVGELEAEIEEWSGTAVQNGMEADRLRELLRDTWDAVGEFAWDSELEARIDATLNPAPANKENGK